MALLRSFVVVVAACPLLVSSPATPSFVSSELSWLRFTEFVSLSGTTIPKGCTPWKVFRSWSVTWKGSNEDKEMTHYSASCPSFTHRSNITIRTDGLSGHEDNLSTGSQCHLAQYSGNIAVLRVPVIGGSAGGCCCCWRFWVIVTTKPEEVQLEKRDVFSFASRSFVHSMKLKRFCCLFALCRQVAALRCERK